MTIEENKELKEALKLQGLIIKRNKIWGKHEWVAYMMFNAEDGILKVVDCSYENMSAIKYRKQIMDFDIKNLWECKDLKDCTVDEVLLSIKRLSIQIKEHEMNKKLNRIKEDFE